MSSRKEEKERLRREREAQEEARRRSEARRKRLVFGGGGLAALAAAVVVVLLLVSGGDGDGDGQAGDEAAPIPARAETDLDAAARAAGCRVQEHEDFGNEHSSNDVDYRTNPPTSGEHDPVAAADGQYAPGNPPDKEQSVHALEHGRINIQYRPGTPPRRIAQLETLFNEEVNGQAGYHTLLYENQTGMEAAVAATGWTRSITCPEFNDRVFDALRAFREEFVDKGPEFIP